MRDNTQIFERQGFATAMLESRLNHPGRTQVLTAFDSRRVIDNTLNDQSVDSDTLKAI